MRAILKWGTLCPLTWILPSDDYLGDKVIASLICFTIILALSNLGTSFASAILAKDTTVSNRALTNRKGETLATNTEADTFTAATYYSGKMRLAASVSGDCVEMPMVMGTLMAISWRERTDQPSG